LPHRAVDAPAAAHFTEVGDEALDEWRHGDLTLINGSWNV
jgi:hypothetical protein